MTGLQVFNIAMSLSDNLVGGIADNADTREYKDRMVDIINSYLPEIYQYSDTKVTVSGFKPVPVFINNLDDNIDLDEALAYGVLPHAVVAALLADENPSLANYHEQKYLEKLRILAHAPVEFEPIIDVYGITDGV